MQIRALALVVCASCASEGGQFLPGDDPGVGTGTLRVIATAVATPRFPNAAAPDDYDTAFRVRIDKGDVRVTTGTVTVASVSGPVALTLDTRDGGQWLGSQAGYRQIYTLDVFTSADDGVSGVRIDGPDPAAFTAPAPGATVDATVSLPVTWHRVDTAARAVLRTDGAGEVEVPDTGSHELPPGSLASAADRAVDEELVLERSHALALAGGTEGSTWTLTARNAIKLVVAPTAPMP